MSEHCRLCFYSQTNFVIIFHFGVDLTILNDVHPHGSLQCIVFLLCLKVESLFTSNILVAKASFSL